MFLTGLRSAWQSRDLGRHFPKTREVEVSPPATSLLSGELLLESPELLRVGFQAEG